MNGVTDVGGVPMVHTGGNGCGEGWMGMLLVIALLGGGLGFGRGRDGGYGGGGELATHDRHVDNQFLQEKLFGLQKDVLLQGEHIMNKVSETGYQNALGQKDIIHAMDSCCCTTNRNIDSVKFENAQNTCKIIDNANANTQRLIDHMTADRFRAMERELAEKDRIISENRIVERLGGRPFFGGFGREGFCAA